MKFFSALFDTSPGLNRSKFLFRDYPKKKIKIMYSTIYLVMHLGFLMWLWGNRLINIYKKKKVKVNYTCT